LVISASPFGRNSPLFGFCRGPVFGFFWLA